MKILHDPSIFERKPLNFFNRSGGTVLYRRGKKDREEAYSMGNSQTLRFAFCCTYGSRQFASGYCAALNSARQNASGPEDECR